MLGWKPSIAMTSTQCRVCSAEYAVPSMQCRVCSAEYAVPSVACESCSAAPRSKRDATAQQDGSSAVALHRRAAPAHAASSPGEG
eukprot:scaffold96259_cov93-Phaeocystis_antarctica.AAC.2